MSELLETTKSVKVKPRYTAGKKRILRWGVPMLLEETAELLNRLEDDGAALAAGACPYTDGTGLVGDERGHTICLKAQALEAQQPSAEPTEEEKEALKDSILYGYGYLRINPDGTTERIDPASIILSAATQGGEV